MASIYKLYSATGEYKKTLDVVSDKFTQAINKLDELELEYTGEDPDIYDRVIFKDDRGVFHELVVMELNAVRSFGMVKSCYCVDSFIECAQDYVDDRRFRNSSAGNALTGMLENSRFQLGNASTTKLADFNIYHTSPHERLNEFLKVYECEFKTRIEVGAHGVTARYIDIGDTLGNELGRRFEYSKDLLEVERKYEPNIIYTAMYGYGKGESTEGGGYGRRIDFASVNNGKKYVEDTEAIKHFGRPTNQGTKQHSFGTVVFDQVEDKQELLQKTQAYFKKQLTPRINYRAKVVDLKAYGFDFEGVGIGDSVTIIDKSFTPELRIRARVSKLVTSVLDTSKMTIELGSYTNVLNDQLNKYGGAIDTINQRAADWDKAANAFDKDGKLQASYLKGIFEEINRLFLSANTYIQFTKERGLLFFNHPDEKRATWAMQLSSAGWRIASSKLSSGEWDWKTAATGTGITADRINAGILRGGASHWNLSTGDLSLNGSITSGNDTGSKIILNNGTLSGYNSGSFISSIDYANSADVRIQTSYNGSLTSQGYKKTIDINAPAVRINADYLCVRDRYGYETVTGQDLNIPVISGWSYGGTGTLAREDGLSPHFCVLKFKKGVLYTVEYRGEYQVKS